VRQWRATANGLEGAAELANETLLVLDELAQLAPVKRAALPICWPMVAANRAPRKTAMPARPNAGKPSFCHRGSKPGRSRAQRWPGRRNPAGQEVRILDIEADAGAGLGLFNTLHDAASGDSLSRAIKHGAGFTMAMPVLPSCKACWANKRLARLIRAGMDAFTRQSPATGATGQETRACQRLGLLAMAGELATRNGILPWPEGEATRAARTIFADWLAARGGMGAAEDRAAVQQVAGFIAPTARRRFQPITGRPPP
jgi:putative DNA primase/helicase